MAARFLSRPFSLALAIVVVAGASAHLVAASSAQDLGAPWASGAGAGDAPQIVDPARDPTVIAWPPIVGVPEPSVDLLSVAFAREGDMLVVTIEVEDVDFRPPYPATSKRQLYAYFESDVHERVSVGVWERPNGTFETYLTTADGNRITSHTQHGPAEVDPAADTLVLRVPLDAVGGRVLQPRAGAWMNLGDCNCWMPIPLFGFQDHAPNEGTGSDFDPYSGR